MHRSSFPWHTLLFLFLLFPVPAAVGEVSVTVPDYEYGQIPVIADPLGEDAAMVLMLGGQETSTMSTSSLPTVDIHSPAGTVYGPFDITGEAVFAPTSSTTKGVIRAYINTSLVASKSCATEVCSFGYQQIYNKLIDLNHGSYTVKLTAIGGGPWSADRRTRKRFRKNPFKNWKEIFTGLWNLLLKVPS